MYKNKKILALIPARDGSLGIPNKNLIPLKGKPLLRWTIELALKSQLIDAVYCSTNGKEIKKAALKAGCKVIDRPDELCQSTSPTITAVTHALETLKTKNEHYDYMLLLQPTNPFRSLEIVDGIIKRTIDLNLESMVSVHKIPFYVPLIRLLKDNTLEKIYQKSSSIRRQDMKDSYYVNGTLYIHRTDTITNNTSLNDIPNPYVIDSKYGIDINTKEDLEECESMLKNYSF